jgi:hypothetical protein
VAELNDIAPVALFVYNRPAHTRATLAALRRNTLAPLTDLILFCDGATSPAAQAEVDEVRAVLAAIDGFRSLRIVASATNRGLARSIIHGVTAVVEEFGRVIVIEDDLVTAPSFLQFMNESLRIYEAVERVGSIHGYWYPVAQPMAETFFLRGASCWGWATWLRAWRQFEPDGQKLLERLQTQGLTKEFDLDGAIAYTKMLREQIAGRNDSWAIRWHASMFLADQLQLSPGRSLVSNIGFDGTGVHCSTTQVFDVHLSALPVVPGGIPIAPSSAARAALIQYYRSTKRSLPARIFGRLRRLLKP